MFTNVLVGVDGRPNGRDAIELAARLIDRDDGKLTLAHVHPGSLSPTHAATPGRVRDEQAASSELLERERAQADVAAELVSVTALYPGRGLHEQAEDQGADLLVVGSSSHGLLGRAMLGDDTRSSLNGAPCAVAIAARGYGERPTPLATIGVGYDESPESTAALAAAQEIAQADRSRVVALDVVSLPTYSFAGLMTPALGDSINLMLEETNERVSQLPGVDARAVYGLAGEELAAFGDEVDLLVVGSRSYGPWRRLVLGSTSNYLQRHARCCLLVLPRVPRAGDEGSERDGAAESAQTLTNPRSSA
jgi:nucleotide-binding universal stress UspA family protein